MGNVNELQERREDHLEDGDCSTASSNSSTNTSSFSSSADAIFHHSADCLVGSRDDGLGESTNCKFTVSPVRGVVSVPQPLELDTRLVADANEDSNQEVIEPIADDSLPLSESAIPISFEVLDEPSPISSENMDIFFTPDIPQVDVEIGTSFSQLISSSPVKLVLEESQISPGDPDPEAVTGTLWLDAGRINVIPSLKEAPNSHASGSSTETVPNSNESGLALGSGTSVSEDLKKKPQHIPSTEVECTNFCAQRHMLPAHNTAILSWSRGPEEMHQEISVALKDGVEHSEKLSTVGCEPVKHGEASGMDKGSQLSACSNISSSFGPHTTDTRTLMTVDEPQHMEKKGVAYVLSDPRVSKLAELEEPIPISTYIHGTADSTAPEILQVAKSQLSDDDFHKVQGDAFEPSERSLETSVPLSAPQEGTHLHGHTADKPNWALAPVDATRSPTPSISQPRKNERRRGGRRRKQSNASIAGNLPYSANDNTSSSFPLGASTVSNSHLNKRFPLSSTPTKRETTYVDGEPVIKKMESKRGKHTKPFPHQDQLGSTRELSVEKTNINSSTSGNVLEQQLHRGRIVEPKELTVTTEDTQNLGRDINICPSEIRGCEKQDRKAEGLYKTDHSTVHSITEPRIRYLGNEPQHGTLLLHHSVMTTAQKSSSKHKSDSTHDHHSPLILPRTPEISNVKHTMELACSQTSSVGTTLKSSSPRENSSFVSNTSIPLSLTAMGGFHKTFGTTTWPSLDEELRFHANERPLLARKKDLRVSQANTTVVYSPEPAVSSSDNSDQSYPSDLGGLRPTTKPRHVTFDDSVRVNLPSRKIFQMCLQQDTPALNRPLFTSNIPVPTHGQRSQASATATVPFLNAPFYLCHPPDQGTGDSTSEQDMHSISNAHGITTSTLTGYSRGRPHIQQTVPDSLCPLASQSTGFNSNRCAGSQPDKRNVLTGRPTERHSFPASNDIGTLGWYPSRTSLHHSQQSNGNGKTIPQHQQQIFQDGSSNGAIQHQLVYFGHAANGSTLNRIPSWNERESQVSVPSLQGPRDERHRRR